MTGSNSLDVYRWLTGDEGAAWLERATRARGPLVGQVDRLRRHIGPAKTHVVLQQVELRRRGRAKFASADRMFFTPLALEQATDQVVSGYKALRFPSGEPIADLCCGIGGDLLGLAGRSRVLGIERDPVLALLAEANGRVWGYDSERVEIRAGDVASVEAADLPVWHVDPDRRPEGRRTTRVSSYEPGLPVLQRLLDRRGDAAVKLAPAAEPPPEWADSGELEWISRDRQCRQLVVWFGRLARAPGSRRATIVGPTAPEAVRTLLGRPEVFPSIAGRIGRFVFDPDPAVLAAGLTGSLALDHGLEQLDPRAAYLTADGPVDDPALACFEVTDVLPLDLKRLRRLVHSRGIGRLEIKKRGTDQDPEHIRRRLNLRGEEQAVLLIAPFRQAVTAILAKRRTLRTT